jgi:hypothetical protein
MITHILLVLLPLARSTPAFFSFPMPLHSAFCIVCSALPLCSFAYAPHAPCISSLFSCIAFCISSAHHLKLETIFHLPRLSSIHSTNQNQHAHCTVSYRPILVLRPCTRCPLPHPSSCRVDSLFLDVLGAWLFVVERKVVYVISLLLSSYLCVA